MAALSKSVHELILSTIDSNISLELTIINNPIRKAVHDILKCDIFRN